MHRFAREPLFWFLLAGALIFVADRWWSTLGESATRIDVTQGQIRALADKWSMQMGRAPTEQELGALIEDHVHEEILYREAQRIGLDRDDTIIRRRLAQKMSFLIEDAPLDQEVDEEALAAWYRERADDYRRPVELTFTQIYFRGGGAEAEQRARTALGALGQGARPATLGDPFMLQRSYAGRSLEEIGRLFGDEFARQVAALPKSAAWQGPIASTYGLHLVLLQAHVDSFVPPLAEVVERVREDYLAARRRAANEEAYRQLRARYEVRVTETPQP